MDSKSEKRVRRIRTFLEGKCFLMPLRFNQLPTLRLAGRQPGLPFRGVHRLGVRVQLEAPVNDVPFQRAFGLRFRQGKAGETKLRQRGKFILGPAQFIPQIREHRFHLLRGGFLFPYGLIQLLSVLEPRFGCVAAAPPAKPLSPNVLPQTHDGPRAARPVPTHPSSRPVVLHEKSHASVVGRSGAIRSIRHRVFQLRRRALFFVFLPDTTRAISRGIFRPCRFFPPDDLPLG